jgi:hypothetical protein
MHRMTAEQQLTEAQERITALEGALSKLRQEVAGLLGIAEPEIRYAVGHSNVATLKLRISEADALLTPSGGSSERET